MVVVVVVTAFLFYIIFFYICVASSRCEPINKNVGYTCSIMNTQKLSRYF